MTISRMHRLTRTQYLVDLSIKRAPNNSRSPRFKRELGHMGALIMLLRGVALMRRQHRNEITLDDLHQQYRYIGFCLIHVPAAHVTTT
jgi:hypothetical protein